MPSHMGPHSTAIFLSALTMSAIVAIRYLATSGFFAWLTRRVRPGLYDRLDTQMRREIRWSLMSAAIYGIPAGIVAWGWDNRGWTQIYTDISAYPLWYVPLSLFLYLFAHDTWFYWTHRLMHRPWWFKIAHAVHHESRPPTAWAAMSFHPWEALTGAIVIPLLVFIIPVHIGILAAVLTIMTVMGIGNHMGWEMFPRWIVHGPLGRALITATHHQKHHEAYRGNYGLYFRFWDKICGTDIGLGDFGLGRGIRNAGPRSRG
ncbi:sterol desaturase family protein [Sphingorhabdus arenilitoris]|uniref:Sterol desaturase family protein n=1 Tax=Sphingorhabdus arenilitoris TaxID=1490041 RepID=A0ABV8RDU5_9SPHN